MERRLIQLKQIEGSLSGDKHYRHEQTQYASVWTVHHELGKYPSVNCHYLDNTMQGIVNHLSNNILEIKFCIPCKGIADCN